MSLQFHMVSELVAIPSYLVLHLSVRSSCICVLNQTFRDHVQSALLWRRGQAERFTHTHGFEFRTDQDQPTNKASFSKIFSGLRVP
jgi:hypothetical protein